MVEAERRRWWKEVVEAEEAAKAAVGMGWQAAYGSSFITSVLTLPGKGEKPDASALSPPAAEVCSSASSWLYSTLITSGRSPSLVGTSLQMAPAASPGERGTVSEFIAKPGGGDKQASQ